MADLLARAFATDPVAEFIFPGPAERGGGMGAIFSVAMRFGLRHGCVDFIAPAQGAAIWVQPEHGRPSLVRMLGAGFWRVPLAIGWRAARRALRYDRSVQARRTGLLPERHWYLFSIGVSPEFQSGGIGSRLLQHGVQRATRSGFRCCLETSKPGNLGFYQKHGFRALEQCRVPGGGPPFWVMATGLSNVETR